MFNKSFLNKKILIYGLGLSGNSCLKYLYKNNKVKVYDDNIKIKNKLNNKYFLSKKQILKLKFDYVVISPGIDIKKCLLTSYLLKNLNKIITELDIFYLSYPNNTKITITGTNGKSTTCKMLYEILKLKNLDVRLIGNIGKPPLEEKKIKKKTIFVIEASSYQIFYNKYFKTDYAAILNLNVDHLERHKNINLYALAKLKLISDQNVNKLSFIEKDNAIINKHILKKKIRSKIIKVKYNRFNYFKTKIHNNYLLDKNNLNNIHFVYKISKIFKISNYKIFKSLNLFKGLKFRNQIVLNKPKLKIINDSKSTSFSSTNGLLSTYKNIYWIVGGKFKKGDKFTIEKKYHKNIKAYIIGVNKKYFIRQFRNKIKFKKGDKFTIEKKYHKNIKAYIIGVNKKYFIRQFRNKIKFKYCKYLKNAILSLKKDIKNDRKDKTILFSPAAASFDQFKNFEHRGYYFDNLIKKVDFNGN